MGRPRGRGEATSRRSRTTTIRRPSSTIKHGVHVHAREFASTNTTDSDRPIPRSSPPISRLGVSACMHAYTYTIVLYRPTNPSPLPAAVTVPVARPLTLHRPDIIHRHTRTKHITSVTYLRLIQNAETNFKRMAWPRKVKSTGGGGDRRMDFSDRAYG